jgi:hypothetical protein
MNQNSTCERRNAFKEPVEPFFRVGSEGFEPPID